MAKMKIGKFIVAGSTVEELEGESGYWDHDLFDDIFSRADDKKKYTLENGVRVVEITYIDETQGNKKVTMFLCDDRGRTDSVTPMAVAKEIMDYHKDKDGNLVLELASTHAVKDSELEVKKSDKERRRLNTRLWFKLKSGLVKVIATAVAVVAVATAVTLGTLFGIKAAESDSKTSQIQSDETVLRTEKLQHLTNEVALAKDDGEKQGEQLADPTITYTTRDADPTVTPQYNIAVAYNDYRQADTNGVDDITLDEEIKYATMPYGYWAAGIGEMLKADGEKTAAAIVASGTNIGQQKGDGSVDYFTNYLTDSNAIFAQQLKESKYNEHITEYIKNYADENIKTVEDFVREMRALGFKEFAKDKEAGAEGSGITSGETDTESEEVVTAAEDKIGEGVSSVLLSPDGTKVFIVNEDQTKMHEIDLVDEEGNPVEVQNTADLVQKITDGEVSRKYDPATAEFGDVDILRDIWVGELLTYADGNKNVAQAALARIDHAADPTKDSDTVTTADGYWSLYSGDSFATTHNHKLTSMAGKLSEEYKFTVVLPTGYTATETLENIDVSTFTYKGN